MTFKEIIDSLRYTCKFEQKVNKEGFAIHININRLNLENIHTLLFQIIWFKKIV